MYRGHLGCPGLLPFSGRKAVCKSRSGHCHYPDRKYAHCLVRFLLRGKLPLRRLSCAAGSHCGSCLHIDWPGGTDKYLYHYLYLYCVPVFRSCAGAYHPLPGIFSDRLRGQRHCCGAASGHIFHNSGAQYFQLVSEISVPHLCLCLQAVRACSCRPVCRISFWRNSRHSADCRRTCHSGRSSLLFPAGKPLIPSVQAKEARKRASFLYQSCQCGQSHGNRRNIGYKN